MNGNWLQSIHCRQSDRSNSTRRPVGFLCVFAVLAYLGVSLAAAQDYPSKPLRLIVPAAPGTPPDTDSRWVAERLTRALGQQVIVDNRTGAGGIIGSEAIAKSPPDGYTLGFVHQGHAAFNPFLYARLGYDPIKDFVPVSRMSTSAFVLAVHPDVKANSTAELVRLAKEQPGRLSFGSPLIGTPPHIAEQLFRRMAGIDTVLVPYKSGSMAVLDLVAGRVQYTLDTIGLTLPHAKAGKVRMLAVSSGRRVAQIPGVPTIAESGVPGYDFETWFGFWVPAGTPQPIVSRLNAELQKILGSPESAAWFTQNGGAAAPTTPEAFSALIRADYEKLGPIIENAGIKLE
jgi:tripartite-type tricarboxylate transporter receptor subunit TctC